MEFTAVSPNMSAPTSSAECILNGRLQGFVLLFEDCDFAGLRYPKYAVCVFIKGKL